MQSLKEKTSRKLLMEYKNLSRAFWGRHMWAVYFATTSGNVTGEVIMKYIEEQGKEPPDGDFKLMMNDSRLATEQAKLPVVDLKKYLIFIDIFLNRYKNE